MFENAGLIGLGLMGGSLARVMKKQGLAKKITGYTKSLESSQMALQIGIIDEIAQSPADIAAKCDLIIICTPLSTYAEIFKNMAPILKGKNTIITDVGSLKSAVIADAKKILSTENIKNFIPAHPIAGTEKTGVMAGFDTLYLGKKTILTTLPENSPDSINKVSKLWQECGSIVEILDANLHDKIYAEVSHLPQFLAYCYGNLLHENANLLEDISNLKNKESFLKFSRICASDPVIWWDIFSMNKQNLAVALKQFIASINAEAENKNNQAISSSILLHSLPILIATALINSTANAQYAGSGFKDFTSAHIWENSAQKTPAILIENLLTQAQKLMHCINENDHQGAMNFMGHACGYFIKQSW